MSFLTEKRVSWQKKSVSWQKKIYGLYSIISIGYTTLNKEYKERIIKKDIKKDSFYQRYINGILLTGYVVIYSVDMVDMAIVNI